MAVCQNSTVVVCGFFTEFDPWKILITSQAWWKVIHIVELLTVWKGFDWGFYVKIKVDKLIHAHKFLKSQN
jgi:hypothetical protein